MSPKYCPYKDVRRLLSDMLANFCRSPCGPPLGGSHQRQKSRQVTGHRYTYPDTRLRALWLDTNQLREGFFAPRRADSRLAIRWIGASPPPTRRGVTAYRLSSEIMTPFARALAGQLD